MKKIETIWHYLLFQAIEKKEFKHTQAGIAELFHFSTSTINLALAKPTAIGAVRKSGKFFVLADHEKLLYLWATIRNPNRDILYQATSVLPIAELEGLAPAGALYGGYSAASHLLNEPSADYTTLYLYVSTNLLPQIKARYPTNKQGTSRIIALALPSYSPTPNHTSLPHTFVDLWNSPDWYARDFTIALKEKFHDLLS